MQLFKTNDLIYYYLFYINNNLIKINIYFIIIKYLNQLKFFQCIDNVMYIIFIFFSWWTRQQRRCDGMYGISSVESERRGEINVTYYFLKL